MPARPLVVVLGTVGVVQPDGSRARLPGIQPATALALLALEDGPVSREALADVLWPDAVPPHWAGAVRGVITKVRAFLAAQLAEEVELRTGGGRVELHVGDGVDVDVRLAADEVDAAEAAVAADRWAEATDAAAGAAGLLHPPLLPDVEAPALVRHRQRLDRLARRADVVRARAATALGTPAVAAEIAARLFDADPFDEVATRTLMEARLGAGDRAGALVAYERLRRRLDDDLGVRPSPATDEVWRQALGDAPAPRRSESAPAVDRSSVFVGRASEQSVIHDVIADATRRRRLGAVVVHGPAGVGKTRLVDEVVRVRTNDVVLWGRGTSDRLPMAVVAEAIGRHLARDPVALRRLERAATLLAPLLPDLLVERPAPVVAPSRADLGAGLHHAVATVLDDAVETAAGGAVLLVVDDVQDADDDSLAVLRHLVHHLREAPVVVLAIVRDPVVDRSGLLVDLDRAGCVHVPVAGLDVGDLEELLRGSGIALDATTATAARRLHDRTGGHPFFAHQVIEDARRRGVRLDTDAAPRHVLNVLERRVDDVDEVSRDVLAYVAIAGDDVDLDTLDRCLDAPADVLAAVEDLCRRGLLIEAGVDRVRPCHGLLVDAVTRGLSAYRQARLHARMASALPPTAPAAAFARHLAAAGPGARADAISASLRAGHEALHRSAWSAASTVFGAVADAADAPATARAEALVGLGRALRAQGRPARSRERLEEALALARAEGLGRTAAAATLALVGGGGRGVALDVPDAERTAALRRARAGLGSPEDDDLVVPVLLELAISLLLTPGSADERAALVEEADAAARRRDDADLRASALLARRTVAFDPADAHDRVRDAGLVLAWARSTVAPETLLATELGRVEDHLLLGQRDAADAALEHAATLAGRLRHPYWSWATIGWQALVAAIDGRLDDAEELSVEALGHQSAGNHPEAAAAFGVQLVDLRLLQGRAEEVVGPLADAAEANPHIPAYRAVLALALVEAGDADGARPHYEHVAADGFAALPTDTNRFLALGVLADVCAAVGDADRAPVLRRLLAPWRGCELLLNCYGTGGAWWGPVSLPLAHLAAMTGDEAAAGLLEEARRSPLAATCPPMRARLDRVPAHR